MSEEQVHNLYLRDWQRLVYENSKSKGFHEETDPVEVVPLKLALIHEEVSEALDCWRRGEMKLYHKHVAISNEEVAAKPEGFPSEIADVVIRCMDLAEAMGFDLGAVIAEKHAFNTKRPYKHGKRA